MLIFYAVKVVIPELLLLKILGGVLMMVLIPKFKKPGTL
jgi:hypothetical protein